MWLCLLVLEALPVQACICRALRFEVLCAVRNRRPVQEGVEHQDQTDRNP